jgi:uncharacterized damage-inducible protein DinB
VGVTVEVLRHHIEYSNWANQRLLDAASVLPAEALAHDFNTADRTITGTLAHIFAAERVWLARVQRRVSEAPFITDTDRHIETLQREWPKVQNGWREWAGSIGDEDAAAVLSYQDLSQRSWQQPLWQVVLHVVNHSTHHRGQVSGFLRALGYPPPPLDFIRFVRDNSA